MACAGSSKCTCGCCSGISVQTPQGETNAPGLAAIAYRTGTWATFRESMLARLSSSDYPALAGLRTRSPDDYSIALLDSASVMLDILTFYQERLANESYLRTATQLDSLTQLSQLIGYQPSPGVSASTYLAFTLTTAPGSPQNLATTAITISAGTTVQSVPAQGQTPQTFQMSADILAKPDWNALAVQTGVPWAPPGTNSVYLSGISTQLLLGDSLLILGIDREQWDPTSAKPSEQWDVVVINQIAVDKMRSLTRVSWNQRFVHGSRLRHPGRLNWTTARIFAFRQKVGVFGNTAPDPSLFVNAQQNKQTSLPDLIDDTVNPWRWMNYWIVDSDHIDLSSACPKAVVGSWFALVLSGTAQLYKVKSVSAVSVAAFGLSAKVTELSADYQDPNVSAFAIPETEAWAQSEELTVSEQPLDYPLYGTIVDLEVVRQDLAGITAVAVIGKSQKITVNAGQTGLWFIPDDGSDAVGVNPGDTLTLLQPPQTTPSADGTIADWQSSSGDLVLSVADSSGRSGTVSAELSQFALAMATDKDPVVQEFALVSTISVTPPPNPRTRIVLQNPLINCYDRTMTSVNANVGLATGGAAVTELLGNGSAAMPNQAFTLKQSPLTYTQAVTPTGRQDSLVVRANGAAWTEVQTLYNQSPTAQVFTTRNLPGGTAQVQVGDNVEGATLPTGQSNIIATYRIGLGSAGNVAAGSITTLVDRPVGVKGVNNPLAATGGQDPQSVDDVRLNAPLSVLTLGRAVSLADYQNFTATFAGIAKAYAIWIPNGISRGVYITVAAVGGAQLQPGDPTLSNLVSALKAFGSPSVNLNVQSFYETLFSLSADIAYDPAYDPKVVQPAVIALLESNYSFASRGFGQGVTSDEVAALIQGVNGVVAVNVTKVKRGFTSAAGDLGEAGYSVSAFGNWISQRKHVPRTHGGPLRICPYVPAATIGALPPPAEILVLDPSPTGLKLGVMK